jgi:NAD(P)-dependent dehydrogenase (short-subunit alcohol dehydrogenase family)
MARLDGKIALVTGGTSGIGFETARLFAREGAKVVITGRSQDAIAGAQAEDAALTGLVADVTRLADLDKLQAEVRSRYGRLDVLFANAGIGRVGRIDAVDESEFDSVFDTNVKGVFFTVQKLLPLMADGGSIILTGSIAGVKGGEAFSVYSATKAALRSFARTWTTDLKTRRIRVNTVAPGPIETPVFAKLGLAPADIDRFKQAMLAQVPLGRIGTVSDVAYAVLYLAADESSFVTGAELVIDGGLSAI